LSISRYSFFLGNSLEKSELAFTDPTPDGRGFATNFTGIPDFLVYK
jgi:N-acetyltransferase